MAAYGKPTRIGPKRLAREVERGRVDLAVLPSDPEGPNLLDPPRPRHRSDCAGVPRPCPFVSCSMHLYLDVSERGELILNFPHLEPWEIPESCARDVAERGGLPLEVIGVMLNLTRERVRQIEEVALAKMGSAARSANLLGEDGD